MGLSLGMGLMINAPRFGGGVSYDPLGAWLADLSAGQYADWDASKLGPGDADVLRSARTAIGTAWR